MQYVRIMYPNLPGIDQIMHRPHVLLAIASLIVAFRGLQVLKLFGVIPNSSSNSYVYDRCAAVGPKRPYQTTNVATAAAEVQDEAFGVWLESIGAFRTNVRVNFIDDLRGLQATSELQERDVILAIPTNSCISFGTFSAATAAAKHPLLKKLLALPDGDTYLEVLALYHEALLYSYQQRCHEQGKLHTNSTVSCTEQPKQQAAVWAAYLDTLPSSISLPVFLEHHKSSAKHKGSSKQPLQQEHPSTNLSLCHELLQSLPHLQRLTSIRMSVLKQTWLIVKSLIQQLSPTAAKALRRLNPCQQFAGFLWAYGMAKTRVVALAVEELQGEVGNRLTQLGVEDIGVMVPLLDMANHASGSKVNARVVGDGTAFRLVATRHIKKGEQIYISYNPTDDENPICSWRWLLEYAFVPGRYNNSSTPTSIVDHSASSARLNSADDLPTTTQVKLRQCYAFNLTTEALADFCQHPRRSNESRTAPTSQQRAVQKALRVAGLSGSSFWVELNGFGDLSEGVTDWAGQILLLLSQIFTQEAMHAPTQSDGGPSAPAAYDLGLCGCVGCSSDDSSADSGIAADTADEDGQDPSSDKQLQCVVKCVLRRALKQEQQILQDSILKVQQQLQSCPTAPSAAAAFAVDSSGQPVHSAESQAETSAPTVAQDEVLNVDAVSSSGTMVQGSELASPEAAEEWDCGILDMLGVAVDGLDALQATLQLL